MTTCVICTNSGLRDLLQQDPRALAVVAHDFLKGLVDTAKNKTFAGLNPKPRGVCIVERCAREIEATCKGCHVPDCVRCACAAELRAAEDRIHAERDAELKELDVEDHEIDILIDRIVEGVCEQHRPFGLMLVNQWYGGRRRYEDSPGGTTIGQ
jgi:hypothetical protein